MSKKKKVICCPRCLAGNKHTYQLDSNERAFKVIGGAIAVVSAVSRLSQRGNETQVDPLRWGLSTLGNVFSYSHLGGNVGRCIDDLVMVRYRCSKCNCKFKL